MKQSVKDHQTYPEGCRFIKFKIIKYYKSLTYSYLREELILAYLLTDFIRFANMRNIKRYLSKFIQGLPDHPRVPFI